MKELLAFRKEFADSQLTYLRALKNTGVTLRQFTESETLELDEPAFGHILPPSPPPPLPPSPPPPPNFSPDLRGSLNKDSLMTPKEEIMDINEDDSNNNTPPPPPVLNTSWEYWDPFGSSSAECEQVEEKWEETKSEFEDEEEEEVELGADGSVDNMLPGKQQNVDLVDDNSSTMSWNTKDAADMAMVVWRSKKTLARIIRELDDHFLKVSAAGGKDIAVFLDVNVGETFHYYNSITENKSNFYYSRIQNNESYCSSTYIIYVLLSCISCFMMNTDRKSNSAKVFNALTWNWSSKSLHTSKDTGGIYNPSEPCKPGAHCLTLDKLYDAEQKLYKEVKVIQISIKSKC